MTTYMFHSNSNLTMAARDRKLRGRQAWICNSATLITLFLLEPKMFKKGHKWKPQKTKNLTCPSLLLTAEKTIKWDLLWILVLLSQISVLLKKIKRTTFKFISKRIKSMASRLISRFTKRITQRAVLPVRRETPLLWALILAPARFFSTKNTVFLKN